MQLTWPAGWTGPAAGPDRAGCAPLPRAYEFLDGSAYLPHVERVRRARGAEVPESLLRRSADVPGHCSRLSRPPRSGARPSVRAHGIDFEAEVVVVTGDVPMAAGVEQAGNAILLVGLVNDVSLRNLIPGELAKGFGFLQSKPRSALVPVLCTPDELAPYWRDSVLHRPLHLYAERRVVWQPGCGRGYAVQFCPVGGACGKARGRWAPEPLSVRAPSPTRTPALGASCLAERRMLEIIADGKPRTPVHVASVTRFVLKCWMRMATACSAPSTR